MFHFSTIRSTVSVLTKREEHQHKKGSNRRRRRRRREGGKRVTDDEGLIGKGREFSLNGIKWVNRINQTDE